MKSLTEMSIQQTKKLLDCQQEMMQKLLSMRSSTVPVTPRSEALSKAQVQMVQDLKSLSSATFDLLESYENVLNALREEDTYEV